MKKTIFRFLAALLLAGVCCSCASLPGGKTGTSVPVSPEKKMKVGLYVDSGASGSGVLRLASLIAHSPQTELVTLMAEDIRKGKLKELDILVMPGGGSTLQCVTIGLEHHEKIREFLRNGGGYVGTCAGMFNVLQIPRRLKLLPFDRISGAGGSTAYVSVEITPEGAKILGIKPGRRVVRYSGGPVAFPLTKGKFEGTGVSLATFTSGVCKNNKFADKFIGSVAWVYGTFGKGKVIATSFHPEYMESTHDMMLGCFYAVKGVRMTPVFPKKDFHPLRVGVMCTGMIGHGIVQTVIDLQRQPNIDLHYVMKADMDHGILHHLDYLVMPHGNEPVIKKYMGMPCSQKQLRTFMDRGGIILAAGNAAPVVPAHKNLKKFPAKVDFKKYID